MTRRPGSISRYAASQLLFRSGSLAGDLALASEAGTAAIGLDRTVVERVGVATAAKMMNDTAIVASSYATRAALVGDVDAPAVIERSIEAAAALGGVPLIVMTGPAEPDGAGAIARRRELLERLGPKAERAGVTLVIEPVHPLLTDLGFVHTIGDAADLVVGIPGTAIVVDTGHVWTQRNLHAELIENIADIAVVQLADVAADDLAVGRYTRTRLGRGAVPVATLIEVLERAGYRGDYEDETLVRMPIGERAALVHAQRHLVDDLIVRAVSDHRSIGR